MKNKNFYNALTTENTVLPHYKELTFNENPLYCVDKIDGNPFDNRSFFTSIMLFPLYLKPVFIDHINNLKITKIPQKKINGYAIILKKNKDVETFLKEDYSKSFRANIKRFVTRFETCFNANYKLFFEHISKNEYSFLMETLHKMLTKRFEQRNDLNKELQNWERYFDITYELIKEKKASIFVIYHNNTPVHICINHHFKNILFISIPSYDIDYAKFALGNISIYKLLEWSLNNNYELLDMAYGDLEYKRRWSTLIYPFEHHIIYNNKILSTIKAKIEINIIQFKNYLKTKNIDDFIKKSKDLLMKKKNSYVEPHYNIDTVVFENDNNLVPVAFENESFQFIKKPIYDFLYKYKAHIDQIQVFEIQAYKEYIISHKNISEKITFL